MDKRNGFTVEELDFLREVEKDIECFTLKEKEKGMKDVIQLVSMKRPKTIQQEVDEEIDEELYSSDFEEYEESSSSDGPLSDLQKEKDAKAALEEELRIRRAETEKKEDLRRKRKEIHALSKASKEQVEKDHTAHLRRSVKDQEQRYAKLQNQMSKMTADLKEKDELIEKFKAELKGNCEVIFEGQKTIKELKQAYEDLSEMKRKFLEQDNEIKSLHISNETLQNSSEAKSNTISMLQERVDKWASGLKEERAKHYKLQRDYEAALSQQQRDKEELIHLTCKNQQLAGEQKRPQCEPKDDHKRQRARDNQLTGKFKQEQGKNNKLQNDLEVALSQQHKDKEELILLTRKNQKLALELKRLRGELKDDHKRQRAQDNQWTAKFQQEQSKNNKLQKELEVALSQQHKNKEELMLLTRKNQQLALEQKRLRAEPKDDPKRELAQDNQWALKFKQEQGKNNKLQEDLEVALSQQHIDKEELMLLTCKDQKLVLELKRLKGELEDDHKRELAQDNHWALKLNKEQSINNKLQKELEVALSQQQKEKEKLMLTTYTNQKLQILEQKKLRGELENASKRELDQDNQWTLKLKKEQCKNNKLQKELEVALSLQQKDKEKLMLMTYTNQKLKILEQKKLGRKQK